MLRIITLVPDMIIYKYNFSIIPLVVLFVSLFILEVPAALFGNDSGNEGYSNTDDLIDAFENFERWCTSPSVSRSLTVVALLVVIIVFWYLISRKKKVTD